MNEPLQGLGSDFKAEETLMVGDDVRDDVLGAQAAGLKEDAHFLVYDLYPPPL